MPFVCMLGHSHIGVNTLSPHPVLLALDFADIGELSYYNDFTCVRDATFLRWRVMLA